MPKRNKFDPEIPKPAFEPAGHKHELSERAEEFFHFCRRAFGTSQEAPLCVGSEPLNGASLKAIYEAFECCYPLGSKTPTPNGLGARREALEVGDAPARQ